MERVRAETPTSGDVGKWENKGKKQLTKQKSSASFSFFVHSSYSCRRMKVDKVVGIETMAWGALQRPVSAAFPFQVSCLTNVSIDRCT